MVNNGDLPAQIARCCCIAREGAFRGSGLERVGRHEQEHQRSLPQRIAP
jgi:hypothetical protein